VAGGIDPARAWDTIPDRSGLGHVPRGEGDDFARDRDRADDRVGEGVNDIDRIPAAAPDPGAGGNARRTVVGRVDLARVMA
jgi:hypothetical protein